MVVVHLKRGDVQFLMNTTSGVPLDELTRELGRMFNMWKRIHRVAAAAKDLAKHGPLKPMAEQGLDEEMEKLGIKSKKGQEGKDEVYCPDPTGRRNGLAPIPDLAAKIDKACNEALALANKNLVIQKRNLELGALEEALRIIQGAVMIAFPQGLPEFDPVQMGLEMADGALPEVTKEELDVETCELWWAGKKLERDQVLSDFVGKNEKTKIIAKLQKKGAGPPQREPPLDEEGQKALMSYYHKKQEEEKRLRADGDLDYAEAAWADPKGLKSALHGGGSGIRWR